jgi:HK97 family phage prohead protease
MDQVNKIEYKALSFSDVDKGKAILGYASIFDVCDQHNDIILPGAFRQSLENNKAVKFLWNHNTAEPIGKITTIKEDLFGLMVKAIIDSNVQKGREAYSLVHNQAINGLSIGYTVEEKFHSGKIRYLKKVNLFEVSLVTFPSNIFAIAKTV